MIHVSLSGGIDSTAALDLACEEHEEVSAWSFDYGQRHIRELQAAARVARDYEVRHGIIPLRGLLSGSALLGQGEVPHGHYADESMRATVVPGRNLLFAAALIARARPGDEVWLGVHAGDHPIYPDCRPEFLEALAAAANAYRVIIVAPWLHMTKDAIIATRPDAPYHLTWSCYEGGTVHCGLCGTCVERREAFTLAGRLDTTPYEASAA